MSKTLAEVRQDLDEEYAEFRAKGLGRIHEALDRVVAATATDDIYALVENLEDVVKDVRTGGMVGSGAKGHREAREDWIKAGGK